MYLVVIRTARFKRNVVTRVVSFWNDYYRHIISQNINVQILKSCQTQTFPTIIMISDYQSVRSINFCNYCVLTSHYFDSRRYHIAWYIKIKLPMISSNFSVFTSVKTLRIHSNESISSRATHLISKQNHI